MSSPSTFECFGLVIHGYDVEETIRRIDQNLHEGRSTVIVTANPEILLSAKRDSSYWNVLRQADLRLVDGIALKFAGWLSGANPKRATGVDIAKCLLQESSARNWKIAIIGGDPRNAIKAAWNIQKSHPNLSVFAEHGGIIQTDGSDDEHGEELRYRLTQYAPDILLIGFGHPKQEMWIARNLTEFPSVKVAIGIGGTIDYWSGIKQRAPHWMRRIGIEWFFRLIHEPKRWRRISRAVLVFPIVFLWDKIHIHSS